MDHDRWHFFQSDPDLAWIQKNDSDHFNYSDAVYTRDWYFVKIFKRDLTWSESNIVGHGSNKETPTSFFAIERRFIVCLLLVQSILAIYGKVRNYEFINFDDSVYVTENTFLRSGLNLIPAARIYWIRSKQNCQCSGGKAKIWAETRFVQAYQYD